VPATPRDLGSHSLVACTAVTPIPDRWSFHGPSGVSSVAVMPRLVVNTTAAAVDAGLLQTVLVEYEPPPAPIHIVHPEGRHLSAKVRLFLDHAAGRLRRKFGP
jgi:hypothetical protein